MNLSQLVDAEWVRDGARERFERVRKAETPVSPSVVREVRAQEMKPGDGLPPTYRKRAPRGEILLATLRAIDALTRVPGQTATLGEIAGRIGRTLGGCSSRVLCYVDAGYLTRSGSMHRYAYQLTARGREYLEAHADA